ncbi:MAG TPA: hypothetical protein VNG93_12945 [Candidatus Dormibacteraeota bacterium]|nr:hypothetical protein [Candidatus Dormibacteraeota bacterium]
MPSRQAAPPIRYMDLVNSVTADLPPLPVAELGPPTLALPAAPLARSRVIIVTSAGVRERDSPPYQPVNDMSFRTLGHSVPTASLLPSHPTPVRRPGERDINVVYPVDRLAELVASGAVGAPAAWNLSFLGTIKRLPALVTQLAPAMVESARAAGAELALLVPL